MSNPLDDYEDDKVKQAARRTAHETELHNKWKKKPTARNLKPLLAAFKPDLDTKVRLWKAPTVNEAAFRADLTTHAIKSFHSYNPDKGASLKTHLNNGLKRSMRYNAQNQNMSSISEGNTARIGPINRAVGELTEDLGRTPTHMEISKFINRTPGVPNITTKQVKAVQTQQRRDVYSSQFASDPALTASMREQEILPLLRPALNADAQRVFDLVYGVGVKKRLTSTSQIAKKLGKSPSQVSRMKGHIASEYKKYS